MVLCFLSNEEIDGMLRDSICQLLRNSEGGYMLYDILLILQEKYPYCSDSDITLAVAELEDKGKIVSYGGYYKIV